MSDAIARLSRLTDALVEDILSLSDEEIRQEVTECGLDIDAEAQKVKDLILEVINQERRQ